MSDNGDPEKEAPEEKIKTTDEGHLAVIKVGDKEHKVVNTVTVMEIIVHKLDSGQEVSQVIAHDFMMSDHKKYMVGLLTDAIMTVMKASPGRSKVKLVGQALMNKFNRLQNRSKGGAFGGKGKIIT